MDTYLSGTAIRKDVNGYESDRYIKKGREQCHMDSDSPRTETLTEPVAERPCLVEAVHVYTPESSFCRTRSSSSDPSLCTRRSGDCSTPTPSEEGSSNTTLGTWLESHWIPLHYTLPDGTMPCLALHSLLFCFASLLLPQNTEKQYFTLTPCLSFFLHRPIR